MPLTGGGTVNKKAQSENDICDKLIRPSMESAGWDGMSQIYRSLMQ